MHPHQQTLASGDCLPQQDKSPLGGDISIHGAGVAD